MSKISSGILQTISGEIERIVKGAGRSVVAVKSGRGNGSGTAWDDHTVVTAYHVVGAADEVEVETQDGKRLARAIGHLRRSDIAVLTVDGGTLVPIERGAPDGVQAGQFVLALANPFASRVSVTSGIVTGPNRSVGGWWGMSIEDAVVTDARVNPGYSGGPLLNAAGRMIGMNVAYFSKRGIAVPVGTIAKVVERLAAGQPLKRAYLGILSNPVALPSEVSDAESVRQEKGVMVYSVRDGSPAKQAGITFGDVILRFNGNSVSSSDDLTGLLGEEAIGKSAKLSILRGGGVLDLEITPGAGREE